MMGLFDRIKVETPKEIVEPDLMSKTLRRLEDTTSQLEDLLDRMKTKKSSADRENKDDD